jgi:hypothetical protein
LAEKEARKHEAEMMANSAALLTIEAAAASSHAHIQMANFETTKALMSARGEWTLGAEKEFQDQRSVIEGEAINASFDHQDQAETMKLAMELAKQDERLQGLVKGSEEYANTQALVDEAKILAQEATGQKLTDLELARQTQLRQLLADSESANTAQQAPAAALDVGKGENDRYDAEKASYDAYAAQHQNDVQANNIILQGIEKQHQDKLLALARAGQLSTLQYERLTAEQKKQLLVGSAGQLLGALATHNKAAFEANKLYSKGKLVVDVASAIGEHMKLPFPMNAIQVGLDVALGATQLSAINSAQFGGGGSISAGGSSAGSGGAIALPSFSQPAVLPAATPTAAPVTQQINLTIIGAKDNPDKAIMSYNSVLELMQQMNTAGDNGHRLNTNLIAA